MKNIIIASRGQEVARGIYDTKQNSIKTIVYESEAETNRENCLGILVHTMRQLQEANVAETVNIQSLNLIINPIISMFSKRNTLEVIGVTDLDKILEATFVNYNMGASELELWKEFAELNQAMPNIKFRKLASMKETQEMKKSSSSFSKNMASVIGLTWDKLPEIEVNIIESMEDEAI